VNPDDLDRAKIWQALSAILDPEFGVNIVDLGLIYGVDCVDGQVTVVMTLTTPTCPAGVWIHEGVRLALAGLPCVKKSEVNLVFDPPWSPERLSDNARRQLGCSPVEF
jgi:metal-sulfur cluster biosynthetic enzyme